MPVELVAEDRDPVDGAAAVKVLLQLLRGRAVVHIPHVHRPGVHLLLLLLGERRRRRSAGLHSAAPSHRRRHVHLALHLLQLEGLLLHLSDARLDRLQLGVVAVAALGAVGGVSVALGGGARPDAVSLAVTVHSWLLIALVEELVLVEVVTHDGPVYLPIEVIDLVRLSL